MPIFVRPAILLLVIALSPYVFAREEVAHWSYKSEGGLNISWLPVSSDPAANQIEISDEVGHEVTSLSILRLLPGARRVNIYALSARAPIIAVGVVYGGKLGDRKVRPKGALLVFDLTGHLLSVFAHAPSRSIRQLAVDDHSNIWTLTDHTDEGVDPATVPMVVEYSVKGEIVREVLTRSMFPLHAADLQEDIDIGSVAMGYGAGFIWFWLPRSTDFVTISTTDGHVARMKTELPQTAGRDVVPLSIARELSGSLVAQVAERDERENRTVAYYTWSPATKWVRFTPGSCVGEMLIGTGENGQVFHSYQSKGGSLCVFTRD